MHGEISDYMEKFLNANLCWFILIIVLTQHALFKRAAFEARISKAQMCSYSLIDFSIAAYTAKCMIIMWFR